jgi:hypothetical protein
MTMTLPQRKASAETALYNPGLLELGSPDGSDRGPANAVIVRLANAIAEQNAAKLTDVAAQEDPARGMPKLQSLAMLVLGSVTLWVVIILTITALL